MVLLQTKDVGLGSFLVIKNDLIGEYINYYGHWESHLFLLYGKLIQPTDVILDAGANIGFHTVQFARLGKKVYAYEPQPIIFNILTANILLNGATEKVEQYRFGLSDNVGSIKMQPLSQFTEQSGVENFGGRGLTTDDNGEEIVELIKFDKDVDVVKMDIQGSEIYALKGMEDVIDRCEPWFLIENYQGQENDKKVLEFLTTKGYAIYRYMERQEDCIAFKPEKHKRIKDILDSIADLKFIKL
jgi:FkbM family methyltransferase